MASAFDAIVIGGGANGLVAASRLAGRGRRVLLVERAEAVGGEGRVREFAPGFGVAPLAWDHGWVPPKVARGLGLSTGDFTVPAVPYATVCGPGQVLSLPRDPARAAEAIRRHSARDAERWPRFLERVGALAGFLARLYQAPPPDVDARGLGEVTTGLRLGLAYRRLGRAAMTDLFRLLPMPVHDLADEWFESEPLRAAVAACGLQGIRQGPRSGGTSFVLLHHLVGAPAGALRGRPAPRHGPGGLMDALETTARSRGVTIRAGVEVARIAVRDDAVAGIVLGSGEEIAAPVVVSTLDPASTLLDLVDPVWLDPEFLLAVRNIKFRGARSTVLYALDVLPQLPGVSDTSGTLAGVLSLTPTVDGLERAADAAKYGEISAAPHVEITVPSLRWPSLAPPGRHVLVAHARFTPYRLAAPGAWDDATRSRLGETVTAAIARALPGFGDRVLHRLVLTPRDLESRYGVTEGAVSHGELTLDQILFMRPVPGWGRYRMPVAGLYLGGAGAHPGPGCFGGPGWLAAERVLADHGR